MESPQNQGGDARRWLPSPEPIGLRAACRFGLIFWIGREEALYDSRALRAFMGIDLGGERVPDETTVMRFRHLLEEHQLGSRIVKEVGRVLQQRGLHLSRARSWTPTVIAAPSSAKNAEGSSDP